MSQSALTLKDRIHQLLKECYHILSEAGLASISEMIENSEKRLMQPMQLAIIGKISSSKSTLVNAILGHPEVVRTGQMEETFNVSWLKYGDSDSDINVIFKDGRISSVPREQWAKWASHQEKNVLKEQVKYIEVFYNHEILKDINIIDTPGLDALSQIDSKNTILFLKEVQPDAVVMLFTKSIAESTLSVLQDFQNVGTGDFNLSALNAIGVLSKADTIWSAMEPEKDIISIGNRVIKTTLYDKYPEVRKSLFSILPVSSLIGLSSFTINDSDYSSLKALSLVDDTILLEMLSSPDFFFDEEYSIDVESTERQRLYNKFGLYGIYIIIESLRRNEDANVVFLSDVLKEKSGFGKFLLTVQSHFGKRSTLIKSQSILQRILNEINKAKQIHVGVEYNAIAQAENLIVAALLSLHEYKEWEYLAKYYGGNLELTVDEADEFIALCGERGYSASERLRCDNTRTPSQLVEIATGRALYWQKQYNIFSIIEPEKADFYKLLISSYNLLLIDIQKAVCEYTSAKETIERTAAFLGLNTFNYSKPALS
ncbi:MAG: dynamin family protein [Muribaculaceae bacterium]